MNLFGLLRIKLKIRFDKYTTTFDVCLKFCKSFYESSNFLLLENLNCYKHHKQINAKGHQKKLI